MYVTGTLNGHSLAQVANTLAKVGISNKDVWDSVIKRYRQLGNEFDYHDMVLFGNAVSKVSHLDKSTVIDISHNIRDHANEVETRTIALLVKALSAIGHKDEVLINSLLKHAIQRAGSMSVISTAVLLDGLYNMGYLHKGCLRGIAKELKCSLKGSDKVHSDVVEAAKATDSIIRTKDLALIHRAFSHSGVYDKELFSLLFDRMRDMYRRFKPVEIVMIANSMSTSRIHDMQLIKLFSKRVLNDQRSFTLDMLMIYLRGICMPEGNDQEFMSRICKSVVTNSMDKIRPKHALTLIQVLSKVNISPDGHTAKLCERLIHAHEELSQLDLVNAITYMTKLYPDPTKYKVLVDRYMELYNDDDVIRNAQQLSILFYAFSRINIPLYDTYRTSLLDLLEKIPTKHFEPIHVSNTLRGMWLQALRRLSFMDSLSIYIEKKILLFTPQLLSSSLYSLIEMGHRSNTLWQVLCREVSNIRKPPALQDYLRFMQYLVTQAVSMSPAVVSGTHMLLSGYDAISRGILKTTEEGQRGENVEAIVAKCIPSIEAIVDEFDEGDLESREVVAAVVDRLHCSLEKYAKESTVNRHLE